MREKDRLDRNGIPRSKGFGFIDCFKHEIAKDLIELISNNSKVFGPKRKPVIEFALEDHRMLRIREMKKAKNEE